MLSKTPKCINQPKDLNTTLEFSMMRDLHFSNLFINGH